MRLLWAYLGLAQMQVLRQRLKFGDHKSNQNSVMSNTFVRDREKIRWTAPGSWCECATYWFTECEWHPQKFFTCAEWAESLCRFALKELCQLAAYTLLSSSSKHHHLHSHPTSILCYWLSGCAINFLSAETGILCLLLRGECKETKLWRQKM